MSCLCSRKTAKLETTPVASKRELQRPAEDLLLGSRHGEHFGCWLNFVPCNNGAILSYCCFVPSWKWHLWKVFCLHFSRLVYWPPFSWSSCYSLERFGRRESLGFDKALYYHLPPALVSFVSSRRATGWLWQITCWDVWLCLPRVWVSRKCKPKGYNGILFPILAILQCWRQDSLATWDHRHFDWLWLQSQFETRAKPRGRTPDWCSCAASIIWSNWSLWILWLWLRIWDFYEFHAGVTSTAAYECLGNDGSWYW